jgi:hypothetical protein
MYVCNYVTQQGRSVCNYVTQEGRSINYSPALPAISTTLAVLQVPRCPCRPSPLQLPIPNSKGYTEAAVATAVSVVNATTANWYSGLQSVKCQHVSARSVIPLTKLCASMAPRKYTCILTPTCTGPDLFPGSSQRSYRQGAIIVSSSSGPSLSLSSGQPLRRNTVVRQHSVSLLMCQCCAMLLSADTEAGVCAPCRLAERC